MATTKVADVIVPSVFQPYVINRTMELSELVTSGIVVNDPVFDEKANGGGQTVNMPFWNDLTGDDEVLSDAAGLTPGKITASSDVAVIMNRGRAWGANDLAKWLAGDDPMAAIGTLVGAYWARMLQKTVLAVLKGIFTIASMAGNLHDVANANVTTSGALLMDGNVMIDALGKLGDAAGGLSAMIVHSAVEQGMRKKDLIDDIPDSEGKTKIATYQGRRVIVDDGMPKAAVTGGFKYTSYLFGAGAFALGNATLDANEAVETDRDSLAGEDYLVNRLRRILHPRGVKWLGATMAGTSPTNAEFETTNNWLRVFEAKQVRIVAVTTNG
jgi:hypothetical protein